MFCHNCGNEIKDGDMFCTKCGTKVLEFDTEVKKEDVKKSSPVKWIVVALLALCLIGLLAIAATQVASGDKDTDGKKVASAKDKDSDGKKDKDSKKTSDNGNKASASKLDFTYANDLPDDFFTTETITDAYGGNSVDLLIKTSFVEKSGYSGGYTSWVVMIKNKNFEGIYINGAIVAYDANGQELERDNFAVFADGGECALDTNSFSDSSGVAEVKLEDCRIAEYVNEHYIRDVHISDSAVYSDSVAISVENTYDFIGCDGYIKVVYFDDNDELVDTADYYVENLLPGQMYTSRVQKDPGEAKAIVYPHLSNSTTSQCVDGTNLIERHGYIHKDRDGHRGYFEVVKNNSDMLLSIYGSAAAYDSDGNMVSGGAKSTLEPIGPGEEIVLEYEFHNNLDFETVKSDVICNISQSSAFGTVGFTINESTADDGKMVLKVTNNGSEDCGNYVFIKSLFMDEDDVVVHDELTSTSRLAVGASEEVTLTPPSEYDHVEHYFAEY